MNITLTNMVAGLGMLSGLIVAYIGIALRGFSSAPYQRQSALVVALLGGMLVVASLLIMILGE